MKKLLLTAFAVTCAASVFAQGTVLVNNRLAGSLVTHIYLGSTHTFGNGTADTPAGTFDWTGFTLLTGSGYTAQVWGALGSGAAESSLLPAAGTTTFRTGSAAGQMTQVTSTLQNVPVDSAFATITVRVWDNKGGTITDWASVLLDPSIARGEAPLFNLAAIGGGLNVAPFLAGLQSFSIAPVPEPSTMALAGLAAASFLIFRRRK